MVNHGVVVALIVSGITYGTPLLLGGLGELLAERGGVLNLGLEGMFLVGAVCAFWASQQLRVTSWAAILLALVVAMIAGTLMSLIHAFVTITLRGNQVVSGLALTIFGGAIGLSSYIGTVKHLGGQAGRHQLNPINLFGLGHVPVIGPILFDQDALVYASWVLVALVSLYLYRTRAGLNLRAVGEDPAAADAMGVNVVRIRYVHTLIGGAFAGLAGAYYTLAISPQWSNGITAGAGWIALALVIFAFWRPLLLLGGAYLFGIASGLGFTLQARGVNLPGELFNAIPYLATVVVLIVVSGFFANRRLGAPSALGRPFVRED